MQLNEEIVLKLNPDGTPKPAPDGAAEKRAEEETELIPVFVHGWVHDIETGEVLDLNISTGPAGFETFTPSETPAVEGPASSSASQESSASSTAQAEPTIAPVAFEPSPAAVSAPSGSAEVKVHGSGSRPVDAPAKKIRRSLRLDRLN